MLTGSHHKKIDLETHWTKVLAVHATGLASRGYSEGLLSSKEPPGRLIERLKDSIEQAVKNTIWLYRIEEFSIGTEGRFPQQKEAVSFQFTYHLDPSFNRLSLVTMKAALSDTALTFPIERNTWHQLPTPEQTYKKLMAFANTMLLKQIKDYQQKETPKTKKKRK